MATSQVEPLSLLYEADETAWLEAMSELVAQRRYAELDHAHLGEYLADMAKRDRREVFSRLVVLLSHLLKWQHQPENCSGSWRGTLRGSAASCGSCWKAARCATMPKQSWPTLTPKPANRRPTRRS